MDGVGYGMEGFGGGMESEREPIGGGFPVMISLAL